MSGISKLGITLTSISSLLFIALISKLLYLLYRHRNATHRKNHRIEPTIAPMPTSNSLPRTTFKALDRSELLKMEAIYGPSRLLYTIKEEEKEDAEIELSTVAGESKRIVSVCDHCIHNSQLQLAEDSHVIVMMGEEDFDAEPPFLTPCASPPYYTPSPSPTR